MVLSRPRDAQSADTDTISDQSVAVDRGGEVAETPPGPASSDPSTTAVTAATTYLKIAADDDEGDYEVVEDHVPRSRPPTLVVPQPSAEGDVAVETRWCPAFGCELRHGKSHSRALGEAGPSGSRCH